MTDHAVQNPRAVVGDNRAPEAAKRALEQLERDYSGLVENVTADLEAARELPKEIADDDEEMVGKFADLIKRLRDTARRIDAFHAAEKEPSLRTGQTIDRFFFALWDKVARRDRKNNPGAADILQARVDDYVQRKIAAENERRRQAAAEAERLANEARERALREQREAEEARLAAERARAPARIEEKTAIAAQAEQSAAASTAAAVTAADKADAAYVDTLAKPADMVRTRVGSGALLTAGTEPYAEVEDYDLLDKAKLWPFINRDAIDKALRAWAKTTGHNAQMPGAKIGKRAKGQVR